MRRVFAAVLALALVVSCPSASSAAVAYVSPGDAYSGVVHSVVLVLLGTWLGSLLYRSIFLAVLHRKYSSLPWSVREEGACLCARESLARSWVRVSEAERASFAAVLFEACRDLGGPTPAVPRSREVLEGVLREAERRYALATSPGDSSQEVK